VAVVDLPAAPAAELDPYLDAARRCFARHGVARTSVQDVARELGVNRTTVYRQVGNVDSMARLLLAREVNRLLESLPQEPPGPSGPDALVDVLDAVVAFARADPVLTKVLTDETELIGPFVSELDGLFAVAAAGAAPRLEAAMEAGDLARRDPAVVAQWLARITLSVVVAPPPGDVRAFLAEILVPALRP
jgi:AcrR family transcriptional regulator